MAPIYQDLKSYRYNLPRERSVIFIFFYQLCCQLFVRLSPRPFHSWRSIFYKMFGAHIGRNVRISNSAILYYPWNITIGDNCWIGDHCNLYSIDKIQIGNNVALAHNIFVSTAAHDVSQSTFETIRKPVTICDEVWIASNAFISMGVTLNRGCVIGACAVVTKDMPEGFICLGFPAKPTKMRNNG